MSDEVRPSVVTLPPGRLRVTRNDEVISTVLGSCVSACVRDPVAGVGGMNHFMLPMEGSHGGENGLASQAGRFGSYAMERLLNAILERGGRRERLEVKVFGGARILNGVIDVGEQNARFVQEYLRLEEIVPLARDLGGDRARRVLYFTRSGRVQVQRLKQVEVGPVVRREQSLLATLQKESTAGRVELF